MKPTPSRTWSRPSTPGGGRRSAQVVNDPSSRRGATSPTSTRPGATCTGPAARSPHRDTSRRARGPSRRDPQQGPSIGQRGDLVAAAVRTRVPGQATARRRRARPLRSSAGRRSLGCGPRRAPPSRRVEAREGVSSVIGRRRVELEQSAVAEHQHASGVGRRVDDVSGGRHPVASPSARRSARGLRRRSPTTPPGGPRLGWRARRGPGRCPRRRFSSTGRSARTPSGRPTASASFHRRPVARTEDQVARRRGTRHRRGRCGEARAVGPVGRQHVGARQDGDRDQTDGDEDEQAQCRDRVVGGGVLIRAPETTSQSLGHAPMYRPARGGWGGQPAGSHHRDSGAPPRRGSRPTPGPRDP